MRLYKKRGDMDKKFAIRIDKLKFDYKNEKIIEELSLEIFREGVTAIAGKNGSGKSTLAKILVGLEKPTEGEVIIDGNKVDYEDLTELREKISLVFQNPNNQIIGTKVVDDLAFALENRGLSREEMLKRIQNLAEQLEITELLEKDPSELSGGQKQIVAIAGILIFNPKIIILDEITSMLDIVSKKKIYELIERLKKNHTIILVTHDPEELLFSDRIIYLEKGRIILDKTSEEFYSDYEFLKVRGIEIPFIVELKRVLYENGEEREIVDRWLEKLR